MNRGTRTMIPGVYRLADHHPDRYRIRVTWSPMIEGRRYFFECVRYTKADLDTAAAIRLQAYDELRSRIAPVELIGTDGTVQGRVYAGRVIPYRSPTTAIPRPPDCLFEEE